MRFAFLDTQRVELEKERLTETQYLLTWRSNMLYGMVQLFLPGIPLVAPDKYVNAHTGIFFCIIVCRALVVFANFVEARDVSRLQKGFMLYYILVSVGLPVLITLDFVMYDSAGPPMQEPYVPVWLLMPLDMSWFVCLALTTQFLPHAPPILVSYSLSMSPPKQRSSSPSRTTRRKPGYVQLKNWEEQAVVEEDPVPIRTSPSTRRRSPTKKSSKATAIDSPPRKSPRAHATYYREDTGYSGLGGVRKSPRGHATYYPGDGAV